MAWQELHMHSELHLHTEQNGNFFGGGGIVTSLYLNVEAIARIMANTAQSWRICSYPNIDKAVICECRKKCPKITGYAGPVLIMMTATGDPTTSRRLDVPQLCYMLSPKGPLNRMGAGLSEG